MICRGKSNRKKRHLQDLKRDKHPKRSTEEQIVMFRERNLPGTPQDKKLREAKKLNKIQPEKGGKLQKWSKKVETITLNMNFKCWSVSSICFPILWVHSLPQRSNQRQQGGEAGAGLATMLVSLFPHLSWVCPPARSLQLLQNVCFVLICICEAFQKLHQCLRELCLGLHGLGAGNGSGTGWNGSDPACGGVGADPRWVGRGG